MKLTITIKTDNAAFENNAGVEVARILRDLAENVEDWPGASTFVIGLRDIKNNRVGEAKAVAS